MKIQVINGPNLNLLGIRERNIYGNQSYDDLVVLLEDEGKRKGIQVDVFQSNHEGELIDCIQKAYFNKMDGIIINPAAYTHTSLAIAEAIAAINPLPVVEVHLSKIEEREEFRQHSWCKKYCLAQITGKGFQGYLDAIELLCNYNG